MSAKEDEVLVSAKKGVTTLTMNRPKTLNSWTQSMMEALFKNMREAASDSATKVAIITGTGNYYSAGVNLSGIIGVMSPATLHAEIVKRNAAVFDTFIDFPKPIIVAVNGPAIGAVVTSATLCDAVVASEKATFSTPFSALGIVPEGCSSVHFERIMGKANAERMLGSEGWKPTAKEAVEAGLITEMVPHDQVLIRSQKLGEDWIAKGRKRWMLEKGCAEEYRRVNHRESVKLADAFLAPPFLNAQYNFLKKKGKTGPATLFWTVKTLRPLWARLLPK